MVGLISIYAAVVSTVGLILTLYFKYSPDKLDLLLDEPNFNDATILNQQGISTCRFFHIIVKNNHNRKTAKNCKVIYNGYFQ